MIYRSVVPVLCILASGCAFKQSEAKLPSTATSLQESPAALPQSTARFRFASAEKRTGGTPADISGTTSLIRDAASGLLKGEYALVLPAVAPDSLNIELNLADYALELATLRAEVRFGDKVIRELPAAAFSLSHTSKGKNAVAFALNDLKTLFPVDAQLAVEVVVFGVDAKGRSNAAASFMLTTPPSKITISSYFPISAFEKKIKATIPDAVKHITLADGRPAEIGGLFEVSNGETSPTDLELPLQLSHALDAVELVTSVSPGECSYSISKTSTAKRMTSELWLVPLTQATVGASSSTIRIAAGDVMHVGVYSIAAGGLVPGENRLAPQTVPTRCMAHCQRGAEGDWNDLGKWGPSCLDCGNSRDNMGSSCFSCMRQHREWCRWQDWRDWKDYTTVSSGIEYSFTLAPAAETEQASNHFIAKFINQTVPGRSRQLLIENVSIKR